jgi:hypothetical protein
MKKYIVCAAASLFLVTAVSAQRDTTKKMPPSWPSKKDSLPRKDSLPHKKDSVMLQQPVAINRVKE